MNKNFKDFRIQSIKKNDIYLMILVYLYKNFTFNIINLLNCYDFIIWIFNHEKFDILFIIMLKK